MQPKRPVTAPRLEIDLDKIQHNAATLLRLLADRGIAVTAITKATLGSPEIASVFHQAGLREFGDSRIENIKRMRSAGLEASFSLIRSPMPSEVTSVVTHADLSFNSELAVIRLLSAAAIQKGRPHGIVLMVELDDLREGIMPNDLERLVDQTLRLPGIVLRGLGTNLACQHGVQPDANNMGMLSSLVGSIETSFGQTLDIVTGGNSGNLHWALNGGEIGRINNLRLGESILLGRETLHRRPLSGLHRDAFTLVAEVIESKVKPSQPWGKLAQTAFGLSPPVPDRGPICRTILAIGHQDTDPSGLEAPLGVSILGASSDHLVAETTECLAVGKEISFQLNYSALVRAMTSPYIAQIHHRRRATPKKTIPSNDPPN